MMSIITNIFIVIQLFIFFTDLNQYLMHQDIDLYTLVIYWGSEEKSIKLIFKFHIYKSYKSLILLRHLYDKHIIHLCAREDIRGWTEEQNIVI